MFVYTKKLHENMSTSTKLSPFTKMLCHFISSYNTQTAKWEKKKAGTMGSLSMDLKLKKIIC